VLYLRCYGALGWVALFAGCLFLIFLNYCITQVSVPYIPPIAIVPVAIMLLLGNGGLSVGSAIVLGLIDDTMCNYPIGLSSLMCSGALIIIQLHKKL
jgi:cell shape-determining protein MreD